MNNSNKSSSGGSQNLNNIVFILYAVLAIYLVYKYIKGRKQRKNVEGRVESFDKRASVLESVLIIMIMALGLFNVYGGVKQNLKNNTILGAIMVILALTYYLISKDKLLIAENGLVANQNFITRKEVKKWGFDKDSGDLVILAKQNNVESREIVRTKIEDSAAINTLIRKYKLKK